MSNDTGPHKIMEINAAQICSNLCVLSRRGEIWRLMYLIVISMQEKHRLKALSFLYDWS